MLTRAEILDTLVESQEKLLTYYQLLTPEEHERACTESTVPGGTPWRPKDHLSHLAAIEHAFQGVIRRALQGHTDPVGFSSMGGATNREEVIAWINQQNQAYVDAHHNDSSEAILADLATTRKETLMLLEQLTDDQLALPVSGAPWSDGSIGGVLITNAHHAIRHLAWVEEGLRQDL